MTAVIQRDTYRRLVLRKRLILGALALLLMGSVLLDLALGPASYSFSDVLGALIAPDSAPAQIRVVMWDIRLPIALMAVAVGAALSLAGAQMQTILNNPLASPFTLGISAAASFGAAMGLAFGVALFPLAAQYMVPLNAFIMAMLSALLIHFLSMRRGVTAETIVLLGIALVFTFNALLALVQFFATEQAVAAVVFWTMGSLTKATWPKLGVICLVIVITLPIFAKRAWALTALRLGDDKAASFGINVRSLRFQTLIMVSLLASFPVAFVGTIGFIGLVGPHIARMLIGEDQRFFLPASLLTGALILSASSVVSKTLIPGAIFPIGVVTSLIGVPFFISLILSGKKNAW
ncbi:iron-siderophore ABC transporter permease [Pseudomonas fluorescens]|jgi:iron complex transport system permease protein|uniref:Iron-siderophore ABC transporter permease n=1 Tax=Pseudomonas gorinensis TaxID=3240790 RepID=A0ACA7P4G4_9PSED|nr:MULTISPECIES: iron ABC transporter permease [Pseudomonas]AHC34855.1 iron-siderophore ABC transporter permease [Pseudomonas sp. TKP]AOE68259.1 iron-siderophore ABC transporter permease [Pseudomonas fluorescens]AOE74098.1 iron-siderophore ABC transporter permease [Pseudomonas fluorescens]MBL1311382.1 iron ABC transporter permease [Pseudomonas sp.]MDR6579110.1 iron complex transport system permease protein [Pseudomonas extremaustralis]